MGLQARFLAKNGVNSTMKTSGGLADAIVSVSDFYRFFSILQDRGYDGSQLTKRIFDGFDHTDVIGPIVVAGLRVVFSPM